MAVFSDAALHYLQPNLGQVINGAFAKYLTSTGVHSGYCPFHRRQVCPSGQLY